jgi:signal peptide peptidase SppA
MHLHRIAHQFFNRPLLLQRASAETISEFLLTRIGAGGAVSLGEDDSGESRQSFRPSDNADGTREYHAPRASRFYGDYPVDPNSNGRPKPYRRTPNGKALITQVGEFVNRGAYVGASSGLISYEGFKYQMLTAADDERTKHIVIDQESPGGEAIGAFEAADVVRQVAALKPVTTIVNGMSCSAAYAIASASTNVVTIPTGLLGSIGVVMLHLDFSKYLQQEGVKPTFIFAGDHKVDGNPYEALPEDVRARFEAEVNSFYDEFVQTVAAGRTRLSLDAIKATQGRCLQRSGCG